MRAREFITEQGHGSLQIGVARALPHAVTIPGLPNQNPYLQYRFGVAIAAAQAQAQNVADGDDRFDPVSAFGDGMIIVNYAPEEVETMQKALSMMDVGPAQKLGTPRSEEAPDVGRVSPVRKVNGALR